MLVAITATLGSIFLAVHTMGHRLLLECQWQSGGRVSEVLRLRPRDLDDAEGALVLRNLKQRNRGWWRVASKGE
jgi:integrase